MNLSNVNDASSSLNGAYFVTGTDTEIGKTTTTAQLVKNIAEQGKSVYAIKPVTSGLETDDNGRTYSDDARRINQFANVKTPLSVIAPIQLTTPCSPHIAAQLDGVTLTNTQLVDTINNAIAAYPADVILVEGAGGWFTPPARWSQRRANGRPKPSWPARRMRR